MVSGHDDLSYTLVVYSGDMRGISRFRLRAFKLNAQNGHITLSNQARETIGLQSEEVVVGTVSSTLKVYAESVAPWQAKAFVSAQIPGRIVKLLVRPGDFVSKNQIVAELSSRESETIKLDYFQS